MEETLTVRIDAELAAWLRQEARRRNTSKGEVVRVALREGQAQKRKSAGETLSGLRGIVTGPRDLSTNRAYLSDLGRRRRA